MKTKIFVFLFFLGLVSVSVIVYSSDKKESQNDLVSANTELSSALQIPSSTPTVLSASTSINESDWKSYGDSTLGISFSYPKDFNLVKNQDAVIIQKKDNTPLINISIRDLKENETVNTVSEKDINEKVEKSQGEITISETIEPIAIGPITAITYKLHEKTDDNTYFYLPKNDKEFLEIVILGENNLTPEELTAVDNIVYSIVVK